MLWTPEELKDNLLAFSENPHRRSKLSQFVFLYKEKIRTVEQIGYECDVITYIGVYFGNLEVVDFDCDIPSKEEFLKLFGIDEENSKIILEKAHWICLEIDFGNRGCA